ncbi:hypothetical protein K435DRAFT_861186 [Dendrothele bispora CBS 962.96]|uniref:Uncharacterized protein n=1 Tax=Dendrothele bispora (strain CBS 962.96) TaxID=1314807 RepID=A0A4S8LWF0_DENBC|nr:hypothetical protein K435DRAFT_861186 [Dendrothele bispora CBS 962.96]
MSFAFWASPSNTGQNLGHFDARWLFRSYSALFAWLFQQIITVRNGLTDWRKGYWELEDVSELPWPVRAIVFLICITFDLLARAILFGFVAAVCTVVVAIAAGIAIIAGALIIVVSICIIVLIFLWIVFKQSADVISGDAHYQTGLKSDPFRLYLTVVFLFLVFGGIHCVPWNFTFPTHTERILWRISAVTVTAFPFASFALFAVVGILTGGTSDTVGEVIGVLVATSSTLAYTGARITLIHLFCQTNFVEIVTSYIQESSTLLYTKFSSVCKS